MRPMRGFTLVEMLLALSITSLVASAVLGMLFAMSQGTTGSMQKRERMLEAAVVRARLNTIIRCATSVLDSSTTHVVLWKGDSQPDGAVNISELLWIGYVNDSTAIFVAEAPAALAEEADAAFEDGTNYSTAVQSLVSAGTLVQTVLVDQVADAQLTVMTSSNGVTVDYEITLANQEASVVGTASLRGRHHD